VRQDYKPVHFGDEVSQRMQQTQMYQDEPNFEGTMETNYTHGSARKISPLSKQILVFLVCAFGFSCLPYFLDVHAQLIGARHGLLVVTLLMWCPALAAFASCKFFRIDIATLGWKWRPARYEIWGYLVPIFYSLPVYLAAWLIFTGSFSFSEFTAQSSVVFGFPHWSNTGAVLLALPVTATIGMVGTISRALGEEIGWRGFLLPRLVGRLGFTGGCFASGCIWAVWHYPLILSGSYTSGQKVVYPLVCFTLMVIASAYVLGWFRLKSKSLWPAAMLHASHNLFIQQIFARMTRPTGKVLYLTTEFGVGLVLTVGACALYFWKRRNEAVPDC
jgi:uncharacterized protein